MAGQPIKRIRKAITAAKIDLAGGINPHRPHSPRKASVKAREDGTAIWGHPQHMWDDMLAKLAELGRTDLACKRSGVPKTTVHRRRHAEPDGFGKQFEDARKVGYERLEDVAFQRATLGTNRPIFYKGEEVGHVKEHSDSLLMFMLEANNRKYAKKPLELTGPNGGPVQVAHDASSKLLQLLNRRSTPETPAE